MKTVLVTGSSGFIGKNLCAKIEQLKDIEILHFDHDDTVKDLEKFLDKADFIFHLAGINLPKDDKEFDTGNRGLTEDIIKYLENQHKTTPILITSSIQADLDNPYGNSKKAAEDIILKFSKENKSPAYIYRLPNVFGKWCKPNYNSVVATFCHNISHNLPVTMSDPSREMDLVYIDEVISEFIDSYLGKVEIQEDGYCYIPRSFKITLQELKSKIEAFHNNRSSLIMPNLEDDFSRFLYATYTSYLPEDSFDYQLNTSVDNRGWLAEFIKSKQFGQIFISKTKPGITRGNHWHHTKIEKFLVVAGEAKISFRKINDQNEVIEYNVSGNKLTVLDIPAGYTHSIKNIGDEDLMTIFWADEIFDNNNPDTYYEEV